MIQVWHMEMCVLQILSCLDGGTENLTIPNKSIQFNLFTKYRFDAFRLRTGYIGCCLKANNFRLYVTFWFSIVLCLVQAGTAYV